MADAKKLEPLPYATKWNYWATALCLYKSAAAAGRDYKPNIRARIYVMRNDRRAWAACKEAYRDYCPMQYGGTDEYWPTIHATDDPRLDLSINTLEWRYYRPTCSTLLAAAMAINRTRWSSLVNPFIHVRVVYETETKDRAADLGDTLTNIGFASVRAAHVGELKYFY